MAVEQMQFAMPVAAGYEGSSFTPSFQAETRKAEEAFTVRAEPEAAILKAKSKAKAKAKSKSKSKAEMEEVVRKAKAKAEAEAAVRKAKAEAAKEAGIVKTCCCGSDDDHVPYDKVYHDSDAEEDNDTIMARIVARWDILVEEDKGRFPEIKSRVYLPGECTGESESDDSDDEHNYEFYLRKFGLE